VAQHDGRSTELALSAKPEGTSGQLVGPIGEAAAFRSFDGR
jgi:hypothetical protein